jgi:hypothetical protein
MGRVYDIEPKAGVRWVSRLKVYRAGYAIQNTDGGIQPVGWKEMRHVFRVEFDADADEGPATVFFYPADELGHPFVDDTFGAAARASCRLWVRVEPMPVVVG